MKMLKIRNWEKFQHYKDRNPPWIKLHVRLLNDRKFCMLSRDSKCLLMLLWVLASENDGHVPNSLSELRFRLRDDSIERDDIKLLIDKQFLILCKQPIADASKEYPETETETETETDAVAKRKRFVPPTLDDVILYFEEKGYSDEIARKAFQYYDTGNWKDGNGKKVKNWKQKMIAVWFKPENKIPRLIDAE